MTSLDQANTPVARLSPKNSSIIKFIKPEHWVSDHPPTPNKYY